MYYPILNETKVSRQMTDTFKGYNHNTRNGDGEFYDMTNLTSDHYPALSPRSKRGEIQTLTNPQGLLAKDALAYVDGAKLYYNGAEVLGLTLSTAAGMIPKQMISMGAYLLIWPDKVYLNTKDLTDFGSMEATFTTVANAAVTYSMCKVDGSAYATPTIAATEPVTPTNGDLWIDTSTGTHMLKQYSSSSGMWIQIATVYIKIAYADIGVAFDVYDGITISGCAYAGANETLGDQITDLNNTFVIMAKGDDYIVVTGLLDQTYTQEAGSVTVARTVPTMDFITESDNRIWGCHYGIVNGEPVNEIYACKLGDFKNWNCFMGISTDSYAVSVGTDGQFTGATTHLGSPLFFKENCIHKLYGDFPASYQVLTTNCRGVQKGSHKSLVTVNEMLYYKSRTDICAFDGSLPQSVSEALGLQMFYDAVAGAIGSKYYISMKDSANAYHLFVYDTTRGLWHREDSTQVLAFTRLDDDLLYIDSAKKLKCVFGNTGTEEADIAWSAETGIIGYAYPDKKYISRFNMRMSLKAGATMNIYIQYDSDGTWQNKGSVNGTGNMNTFVIPIIPRRCDHLKIKLTGTGDCKVFSLAKILEMGSDM